MDVRSDGGVCAIGIRANTYIWNEARNGRLQRDGQARDLSIRTDARGGSEVCHGRVRNDRKIAGSYVPRRRTVNINSDRAREGKWEMGMEP